MRAHEPGTSKVAVNGSTAHLQVVENDRIALAKKKGDVVGSELRSYSAALGLLKAVVELLLGDEYPGGTRWEMEGGTLVNLGTKLVLICLNVRSVIAPGNFDSR